MSQKSSQSSCMGGQTQTYEAPCDDGDRVAKAQVHEEDADACNQLIGKLCIVKEEAKMVGGELSPIDKEIQSKATHSLDEKSRDALSFPSESKEEQGAVGSPRRKQAGWATLESMVSSEPEFTIEASSWPTLAEARHVKSSQIGSSAPKTEVASSVSLPAPKAPPKVAPNQANSQERPGETFKHSNANTFVQGPKYKSPYKKGGFGKQGFAAAAEKLPVPLMGVHVPSANMFVADQSIKGNALMGINNFFPSPHQAPAHGPFYYPRAEGLVPFPHNSAALSMYGRGHLGWQHYGRGYGDANYKHTGFVPPYEQQHMGPRYTRPPVTPFMNLNVAPYNYANYQGDMSYMTGAPSHGFSHATPYFGPPRPPGAMLQAPSESPTLQELLQKQIEYYFSTENLCHDSFLTKRMDDEGFVPLSLIASFPRVQSLTLNSMLILEAMKNSTLVEVKNDKLRSHDWRRWKPISSVAPGTQGVEKNNPSGPQKHAGSGTVRAQENKELGESHLGHFDKKNSLSETRMVAGSCAGPWTGMSAHLGAVSVPAVTSIDSR